ncbi:MAG: pterin-binding protein [Bacteroidetes bacterium]|nr:MAG: pterin-binding protein [Bacteroidota bacterium]
MQVKTILKSSNREVTIDTDGPVVIIGESINPTRRKKLVESLSRNDFTFVLQLAEAQVEAGADVLDVNVGYPGVNDVSLLPATVKSIQEQFDIPLCLDSPNPKAIEAALKVTSGKPLINSVNGEEKSLASILPLVKEHGAAVIGLVMDDRGITHDPEKRLLIAEKILNRAVQMGIPQEDVVIDPMAMAVSADPSACLVTLETIRLVRVNLGLNITQGASNISFGLPGRDYLNTAHMVLSIWNGLTCPIANPAKITAIVRAADLIRARDDYAMRYVEFIQQVESMGS